MLASVDVYVINNKEYYLLKTVKTKNKKYLYLMNEEDSNDIIIRKELVENGEIFLVGLDNDGEFDFAIKKLYESFSNKKEEIK